MTLEAAVRSVLIADNGVFGILFNRIYVGKAPISAEYPHIVVIKSSGATLDNDLSRCYEEGVQITCRAKNDDWNNINGYESASNLADKVKEALRSQAVRNTKWTDSDDTFHIIDCTYRGGRPLADGDIYDHHLDFVIKYTRA